jgi:hypothetical protein
MIASFMPSAFCVAASLEILYGTDAQRCAWFSPVYGQRVPSKMIRATRTVHGGDSLVTWVSAGKRLNPVVTRSNGAVDVRVHREDGCEDTLIYAPGNDEDIGSGFGGSMFQGVALFHRTTRGTATIVRAESFRRISIENLLDVSNPHPIESLSVESDCCDIAMRNGDASGLEIRVRAGMRVTVNGHARSKGAVREL